MGSEAPGSASLHAPKAACPYAPTLPVTLHHEPFAAPGLAAGFNALQTYAAVIAQAESMHRISLSRSRQQRGPPASDLI